MKRNIRKISLVFGALALATAGAYAVPGGGVGPDAGWNGNCGGPAAMGYRAAGSGPMGYGPGWMMPGRGPHMFGGRYGAGDPAAFAEHYLADLKSELNVTNAQEPAWQAFAGKAKQQAESMRILRESMWKADGSAPERIARHSELMKQRIAAMDDMAAAVKALYAILTPEQKTVADQSLPMMGSWHGPRGRWAR